MSLNQPIAHMAQYDYTGSGSDCTVRRWPSGIGYDAPIQIIATGVAEADCNRVISECKQIDNLKHVALAIDCVLNGPVLWEDAQAMLYQAQRDVTRLAKKCIEFTNDRAGAPS